MANTAASKLRQRWWLQIRRYSDPKLQRIEPQCKKRDWIEQKKSEPQNP